MKQTITEFTFLEAFRQIRPDNFSHEGLKALFNWLEAYEDAAEVALELDVIGLCCEFTEYSSLAEFQEAYGEEYASLGEVEDQTAVIRIPGSMRFIIRIF